VLFIFFYFFWLDPIRFFSFISVFLLFLYKEYSHRVFTVQTNQTKSPVPKGDAYLDVSCPGNAYLGVPYPRGMPIYSFFYKLLYCIVMKFPWLE